MKMIVLRPFYLDGGRQEVDAVVEVQDRTLAAALKYEGKARPVVDAAEKLEPLGPMSTESVLGLVQGGKVSHRKGDK